MKKNTILLITAAAAALAIAIGVVTFAAWRYTEYRHAPPAPQGALLRDRSDSNLGGCDDLAEMGREMLDSFEFKKGSSIAVLVSGDDKTADEPVLLGSFDVPLSQRVADGRSKFVQQRQDLLAAVKRRCVEAGQADRSPVYMAIRRAVEYLHAKGCDGRSPCVLYVQSDLEELSEKRIKELLNDSGAASKAPRAPSLPTPIDNSGVEVRICGLSETAGTTKASGDKQRRVTPRHDAQRADRIQSVWERLFTLPQSVSFNSLCPRGIHQ